MISGMSTAMITATELVRWWFHSSTRGYTRRTCETTIELTYSNVYRCTIIMYLDYDYSTLKWKGTTVMLIHMDTSFLHRTFLTSTLCS